MRRIEIPMKTTSRKFERTGNFSDFFFVRKVFSPQMLL
jgi:hypothetical protein